MPRTKQNQETTPARSTRSLRSSTSAATAAAAASTSGAKRKAPPPRKSNSESDTTNPRKRTKVATASGTAATSETSPSKFSFYAMRAGSISKEPVIFFGMDDFHMFVRWASQEKGTNTNTSKKTSSKNAWTYDYKMFDNILDAYRYAIEDDSTSGTTRTATPNARASLTATSPAFTSPIRATATSMRRLSLSTAAAAGFARKHSPFSQEKPKTWEEYFELLKEYKEKFGDCYVSTYINSATPGKFIGLGTWVQNERRKYKRIEFKIQQQEITSSSEQNDGNATATTAALFTSSRPGAMTLEQYEKLRDLDFCGDPSPKREEEHWDEQFQLLKEYKEEFGDCYVPQKPLPGALPEKYQGLGTWVHRQRSKFRKFESMKKQEENEAAPSTEPTDDGNGDKKPTGDAEATSNRSGTMTAEQYQKLSDLGLCGPRKPNKERILMTKAAAAAAAVAPAFRGDLSGMSKKERDAHWNEQFKLLKQYKKKYGDCWVPTWKSRGALPAKYKSLAPWVRRQREYCKMYSENPLKLAAKVEMTKQRFQKLMQLGLNEESSRKNGSAEQQHEWDEKFKLLQEYKEEFGHCHVPDWKPDSGLHEKYRGLASWVRTQRKHAKKYEEDPKKLGPRILMTESTYQKLMDLGLNDKKTALTGKKENARLHHWNEQYELLKEYVEEYGDCWVLPDCDLPERYHGLASWVRMQRKHVKMFEENPSKIGDKVLMTEDLYEKLMDLGLNDEQVVYPSKEEEKFKQWNERFELLKEYKEEYGDCWVPDQRAGLFVPEKYRILASWTKTQRRHVKTFEEDPSKISDKILMTEELYNKLMEIGLNDERINPVERDEFRLQVWNERYELLKEYKEEFGNCWVQDFKSGDKLPEKYHGLASWVRTQRRHLRQYLEDPSKLGPRVLMTGELGQKLLDLGVEVEKKEYVWEEVFELLKEYKEEFGDCCVPTKADDEIFPEKFKPLIPKMRGLRKAYDEFKKDPAKRPNSFMNEERFQKLEELDFGTIITPWGNTGYKKRLREHIYDENFKKKLEDLKAFQAKHGHLNPKSASSVGVWIWQQRKNYQDMHEGKETFLKVEQIVQLTSIGFDFAFPRGGNKRATDRMKEYVEFVKTHGRHPNHLSLEDHEKLLGIAAQKWRHRYKLMKKGILKEDTPRKLRLGTYITQDQIDALSEVGFRWEAKYEIKPKKKKSRPMMTWDEKYELLKDYKARHGHCEPTYEHPKLGKFCHQQRQQYKCMKEGLRSNLTVDRFQKLSDLGFRFKTAGADNNKRKRYVDRPNSDTSESESSDDDDGDENDNDDDKKERKKKRSHVKDDDDDEDEDEDDDDIKDEDDDDDNKDDDDDEYDEDDDDEDDNKDENENVTGNDRVGVASVPAAMAGFVPGISPANMVFANPTNNVASVTNQNWMGQGIFPDGNNNNVNANANANNNANAMATNQHQMLQDMQTRLWAMGKAPRFN